MFEVFKRKEKPTDSFADASKETPASHIAAVENQAETKESTELDTVLKSLEDIESQIARVKKIQGTMSLGVSSKDVGYYEDQLKTLEQRKEELLVTKNQLERNT